ncbi:MAG: NAD(P)/FAD-dependent oxidoreductase [Acidobacteriota bacterium]|nr:NAD(P)/FAD-dependent oxidoreductase [Acidobacteriota bacterium]MDH3523441.1 NAD(P)/FAD-dependent oxidoreductase [Acidobacteriota bacterium]
MSEGQLAILGAGPTGIEAALAAAERGWPFTLYEAGDEVASHMRDWGHVRLFSPWSLDVSPRMRRALAAAGRRAPDGETCPTGAELRAEVFVPLAASPALAPRLRLASEVLAVGRAGLLKHEAIGAPERRGRPFRLLVRDAAGRESVAAAGAVLDCTGSYSRPNRLGDGGIPAPGEERAAGRIVRRIPDFGREAGEWRGRRVLLVGAGHSAQTAAVELAALASGDATTRVVWALRAASPEWHVDPADPLPERSRLTAAARELAGGSSPAFDVRRGVVVDRFDEAGDGLAVTLRGADGTASTVTVDRVLGLTGAVGDHAMYRQLQIHECYATSGPMKLSAALLAAGGGGGDCLAQESHGAETLVNPEPDFFILGAKSYGRNSTFLMRVGWQQVDEAFALLEAAQRARATAAPA